MATLSTFPIPLPPNQPPDGYRWEEHDLSVLSTTTMFITAISNRDKFLGKLCCVICGFGSRSVLQDAHIIPQSGPETVSRTCISVPH